MDVLTSSQVEDASRTGACDRRLRIAFITCVFPPETEPSAVMACQLARALRSHGHDVTTVVPFPNRPNGRLYPGYRRSFRREERMDGVRVIRCANWLIGPKRRPWNRILENVAYGCSSAVVEALEPRPDVLLLETWPLAAAQAGCWAARLRRVPYFYWVQDLYPEVLENSGLIRKQGWMARALRAWDRRLCLSSYVTIAISEGMRDELVRSRRLPADRVVVIPNWIEEEEFRPLPRNNAWRRGMNFGDDVFLALYAGTMGVVSGVDILVEAAARLRDRRDILLLCVGQGVRKDGMIAEANARKLANIRFEPFQDRPRVPEMHAAADVCVLTMAKGSSNASVPSKLISYMAAGRPVICAAPAETDVAKLVKNAGAGLVVQPGDADAIAGAILHLRTHPDEAAVMGANSRRHFVDHLAFRHRYAQFEALFAGAVAGKQGNT